jgi:hypothetical protein
MGLGGIVLSCIFQSRARAQGWLLSSCIVLATAPLALRKLAVFEFSVSRYNKGNQFAPVGAGRALRSRRCCRRYEPVRGL